MPSASLTWTGLRAAALQIINGSASDTTYDNKLRERLNEALDEFVLTHSDGLLTGQYRQRVPRQVTLAAEGAIFLTTDDAWVLEICNTDASPIDGGTDETGWAPALDGSWDGLMWLEFTLPETGVIWQVQTREWWRTGDGGLNPYHYYVSLMYPIPEFDAADIDEITEARIWAKYIYLPTQYLRPSGPPRLYMSGSPRIAVRDPIQFGEDDFDSFQGTATGQPERISLRTTVSFQAPSYTPTVSASQNAWLGPVQEGTFTFCFTLAFGKHDQYHYQGPNRLISWPLFETAPSPPSAAFAHADNPGLGIDITLPNIDFEENFYNATTERHLHSGWYIRVYVARTVVRSAGLGTINQVESDGAYYFLDEVAVSSAAPTYSWRGVVIPDRGQRLRYFSGTYDGWSLHPIPVEDVTIEWQAALLPQYQERDYDVIPVRPQFGPAFRELFLAHVARADGRDFEASDRHRVEFERLNGLMRAQNRGTGVTEMRPVIGRGRRVLPFWKPIVDIDY